MLFYLIFNFYIKTNMESYGYLNNQIRKCEGEDNNNNRTKHMQMAPAWLIVCATVLSLLLKASTGAYIFLEWHLEIDTTLIKPLSTTQPV